MRRSRSKKKIYSVKSKAGSEFRYLVVLDRYKKISAIWNFFVAEKSIKYVRYFEYFIKTKTDLVIGNVFGSNVMNISLVLPAMGFLNSSYSKSGFEVDPRFYESDWQIMLFFTVLLLLVVSFLNIVKDDFLLKFIKFFGAILLTLYVLYILKIANII